MKRENEAPRTRPHSWFLSYVRGSLMIAAGFASLAVVLALAT